MLRGLDPLLGPELLRALRAMGHGDEIAIVDGNYPAETDGRRLVRADGISATDMLAAILSVMPLDTAVADAAFCPAFVGDPGRTEPIMHEFQKLIDDLAEEEVRLTRLEGRTFYERVQGCFAIVATSERRLYGNIVLRKGVIAP